MPHAVKKAAKVVVSIGLAVLLLFLFFRNVDLSAVGRAIAAADRGWLALSLACALASIPLRSWRWTRLLWQVGPVSQLEAFGATCVGFAATTLLPARAGEIVRPAVLARRGKLPFTPLLASIGLERLLDLVLVVALFVAYAAGGWAPSNLSASEAHRLALLRKSALFVGLGAAGAFAALAALTVRPTLADVLLAPVRRALPEEAGQRAERVLRAFLGGLSAVRTLGDVVVVGLSSVAIWVVNALSIWSVLIAFGLSYPFPVSFFVLTWAVLGLAVPTPGGVGGYHAAFAYSLTGFYGASANTAAASALVAHAIGFGPITILGIAFLAGSGLKLSKLAEGEGTSA